MKVASWTIKWHTSTGMFHNVHVVVLADGRRQAVQGRVALEDHTTNMAQKRLRILGDDEIQALYGRPHLTEYERLEYFALSPTQKASLEQLHSIKSRIYFILQLGYFKSHHLFFIFDLPDVEEDARYIQTQYFPDFQLDDLAITKVTRFRRRPTTGLGGKGPAGGNGVRQTPVYLPGTPALPGRTPDCGSRLYLHASHDRPSPHA